MNKKKPLCRKKKKKEANFGVPFEGKWPCGPACYCVSCDAVYKHCAVFNLRASWEPGTIYLQKISNMEDIKI